MVAELLNHHTEVVVQVVVSLPQLHVSGVSAPAVNSTAAGGASVNMVATSPLPTCTISVFSFSWLSVGLSCLVACLLG